MLDSIIAILNWESKQPKPQGTEPLEVQWQRRILFKFPLPRPHRTLTPRQQKVLGAPSNLCHHQLRVTEQQTGGTWRGKVKMTQTSSPGVLCVQGWGKARPGSSGFTHRAFRVTSHTPAGLSKLVMNHYQHPQSFRGENATSSPFVCSEPHPKPCFSQFTAKSGHCTWNPRCLRRTEAAQR